MEIYQTFSTYVSKYVFHLKHKMGFLITVKSLKKNSNYCERPYPELLWGLYSPFFRGKGNWSIRLDTDLCIILRWLFYVFPQLLYVFMLWCLDISLSLFSLLSLHKRNTINCFCNVRIIMFLCSVSELQSYPCVLSFK
jgi:hypothetical protein